MIDQKEQITDKEIILRVVGGEKSLYELIVRRFNPYLYKVGRSYCFNHADTQDLMQDTFVAAYKNLAQFDGRASFKTWIVRIMLNNCYRKKHQPGFFHQPISSVNENVIPMFTNRKNETGKVIQNRELGQIIESALMEIPHDYRMVFSLREISGMNVAETAALLNISESNVKVRLSRAKTMLRKEIEGAYSPGELFEFNLIYCDAMVESVMKKINETS